MATTLSTDPAYPYAVEVKDSSIPEARFLHFDNKAAAALYAMLMDEPAKPVVKWVQVEGLPGEWREVDNFSL